MCANWTFMIPEYASTLTAARRNRNHQAATVRLRLSDRSACGLVLELVTIEVMDENVSLLVRCIHNAPMRWVLACTGGGSRAISYLLTVPGASRSVLEAIVPYANRALIDWLGAKPEQFCSEQTARAMAMAAYQRARRIDETADASCLAGIACTASLASDRPKHGPHRIHIAVQTATTTVALSLELLKGKRDRDAEEELAARLILNAMAETCEVSERQHLGLLPAEQATHDQHTASHAWQDLLAGRADAVRYGDASVPSADDRRGRLLFPGSFHPYHQGHRRMAQVARARLGRPVEFEIAALNVDKPPLDFIEMRNRASQFGLLEPLWFTRAARFVEKADLFPGSTFVVGTDTLRRIADSHYYSDDPAAVDRAVEHLAGRNCRFLVFGRRSDDRFLTLADLPLPPHLRSLCEEIAEADFREDVSSTELRRAAVNSDR